MEIIFFIFLILLNSSFGLKNEKIPFEELKEKDFIKSLKENLEKDECLATQYEARRFIEENNIDYKGDIEDIDKNVKFIAGTCNPIVLIPGIYSTKLKVQINCRNIKRNENLLYQKIKFYCAKYVCSSESDNEENRDLWFNLGEKGFSLVEWPGQGKENQEPNENDIHSSIFNWEHDNLYSGCLGLFMTMFNNEDECPILDGSNKKICGHSHNIKISYEGGFLNSKDEADCGINAIENVLSSPIERLPEVVWKEKSNIFGLLVENLENLGYTRGFSLAGVPNDFRRFISTNDFAYESLQYHIENMEKLTGKPVIIIAHSFGNLVTLNALTKFPELKNKIKKWISLAPPFAGATKAIDYFLHGITDFNFNIASFISKSHFHDFGQSIMLKSIPTVYELQPFTIFYKLFKSEEYSKFAEAIRERINLEKECKEKKCSESDIESKGIQFNYYFKEYFPSLTLDECNYEETVGGNQDANNKKCMTELFNIVDCPSVIKVQENQNNLNDTYYDIEDYCNQAGEDLYYIADDEDIKDSNYCNNLLNEIPYVYDKYSTELEDLIRIYNRNYKQNIKKDDKDFFETKEEILETIKTMNKYLKEKSLIKDLPIPPVDIDIVYSSFTKTMAAEFIDKNNLLTKYIYKKGGDGTVPTWSSLLTALKWIYDKKINDLPQNIRLVEYCSRLTDSNPNLNYFLPISCQCIENNVYKKDLEACSHQNMLSDEDNLFKYINDEIKKDIENKENKKKAIENYFENEDYLQKCNFKLYLLLDINNKIPCDNSNFITKSQYDIKNYCALQGYATMKGRECCSVHVKGYNEKMEKFDEYYCDNIINADRYKEIYKKDIKEKKEFFESVTITEVELDCPDSNSIIIINLKLLLLVLFLLI